VQQDPAVDAAGLTEQAGGDIVAPSFWGALHSAAVRPRSDKSDPTTPAVDQSCLQHLLGYHMAQADIPAKAAFYKYIGEPLKLRHVEFTILMLVKSTPAITQKQLSQTLAVSAPNITILLDRLVDKGWIERVRSETDRRMQHICLTAEGALMAERAHRLSLSCEFEMLRHLTEGERIMLLELLDKVARHRRI
jgi:DNA-binding MarR family transcriptional regulator